MENRSSNPSLDIKFAFNDAAFSDRLLRIEIIADSSPSDSDSGGRKRKRDDLDHEIECCTAMVANVKNLHINSLILAANSPFFYKLFKNGMRESQERDNVTLRINASEEDALMDVLGFLYNFTLSANSVPDLLGVLIVADKFEVTSCVKYCTEELLHKMPMSQESALLYLELHSSVLVGEVVQPLIDAAKQYLVARYCMSILDCSKTVDDFMALPLCAIEVVLGSDGLRVSTEDDVFHLILRWARACYPVLEERRKILTKRLARLIRFPCMSSLKLKEIIACEDFDHEQVSKLVLDVFLNKAEEQDQAASSSFKARDYRLKPVKVVEFEMTRPHCAVYFDLKRDECARLLQPMHTICSQSFSLGGLRFQLEAKCAKDQQSSMHQFGLYVFTPQDFVNCTLDYEFAVMKRPSLEFGIMHTGNNRHLIRVPKALKPGVTWNFWKLGTPKLFLVPSNDFMANDNSFFIDDILHLRARLTINNS